MRSEYVVPAFFFVIWKKKSFGLDFWVVDASYSGFYFVAILLMDLMFCWSYLKRTLRTGGKTYRCLEMSFVVRPARPCNKIFIVYCLNESWFYRETWSIVEVASQFWYFLSRRRTEFACCVMFEVRGGLVCEVSFVIPHKPSDVFLVPLSTGVLSELKMVKSFFVKKCGEVGITHFSDWR